MPNTWNKVNLNHERFNGFKYKVAVQTPKTTAPNFLDSILEQMGIPSLTDKELRKRVKEEGLDLD